MFTDATQRRGQAVGRGILDDKYPTFYPNSENDKIIMIRSSQLGVKSRGFFGLAGCVQNLNTSYVANFVRLTCKYNLLLSDLFAALLDFSVIIFPEANFINSSST